ncbi:unnamed protein product [Bursaphelenchus xylophilus]|uniref:(pine wood nematode) hypothetical protein n=1 Tax=Bursaphelenchus xylophilus TaxID=6326 RepID=A0A1I7RQB0_BURXY|nr:unnamed protein product [Bursaphelenchus xylophilus]CAG9104295.1 unnamed protein product [Bursaphelenchus xylophilus]
MLAASTFSSNMLALPKTGYFDINNAFPPFLHTWSLSAELQFYVVVPFIFLAYRKLRNVSGFLGTSFLLSILAGSMAFQVLMREDTNLSYMNLLSRIWQFIAGFLVSNYSNGKVSDERVSLMNSKNFMMIWLLIQLFVPVTNTIWIDRIICTFSAALFIFIRETSVIEHPCAVYIGGISYSIYLIHWPIITIYKYMEVTPSISLPAGILIIQGCILLSVVVEDLFKQVRSLTTTTARLTLVIFILYLSIAAVTLSAPRAIQRKENISLENYEEIILDTMRAFDNRQNLEMTKDELVQFNKRIYDFAHDFSRKERTNGTINHQVEGNGNLEIVVVGNSISRELYFGIWGRLKNKFKRLTLYFKGGMTPFHADKDGDHPTAFLGMLASFDRPIDILVVRHTYHRLRSHKEYIENDMKNEMEKFYGRISSMPIKNIVISLTEYESSFNHQQFIRTLETSDLKALEKFNFPLTKTENANLLLDKTIMSINCPKCHFVDTFRRLCDPTRDRCVAVDERGVANYNDGHHATLFGSFHIVDEFIVSLERAGIL